MNTVPNYTLIAIVAAVVIISCIGWFVQHRRAVRWLDHEPNIVIGDRSRPQSEHAQMGLRNDGVIVWRQGYR